MTVSQNYRLKTFEKYFFVILFIPLILVLIPILQPGLIINGDFPILDTGGYAQDKLFTWIQNGSYPGVETLPRIPLIALWYILNLGGVDEQVAGKVMIILGFSLASFTFYFAFLKMVKHRGYCSTIKLRVASLVGCIIYAYNVWSFLRIGHWYLWIGYGLIPLFLISTVYAFKNPKNWKYIILSTLLWSFASVTPHMIVFYGLIYLGILSSFIINCYLQKQTIRRLAVPTISILALYALVNMYWIYPLVLSTSGSVLKLGPQYVLTYEIGEILSRSSNLLNVLRLTSDWTNLETVEPQQTSPLHSIWIISSYAVPILAFSALLFRKTLNYAILFLVPVIVGIILSMGTQSPSGYYFIIFSIPLGWLFRDPDKWSFLVSLGYSFLAGIAIVGVLNFRLGRPRNIRKVLICCFFCLFVVAFTIYAIPIYQSTLLDEGKFSPVPVPSEFEKLNQFLSRVQADKVFFMPYPSTATSWSGNHSVESVYQATSTKPNIMIGNPSSSSPNLRNYYSYLERQITENLTRNINNLIHPFGSPFIIYHNDTADTAYVSRHVRLLDAMTSLEGLDSTHAIGFYKIFDLGGMDNKSLPSQSRILDKNIIAVQGLDKISSLSSIPSFNTMNSSILFLDQLATEYNDELIKNADILLLEKSINELALSFVNNNYIVAPYEDIVHYSPTKLWSRAGTMDPLHGEFHAYINELGLQNWDFDYGKGIVMTQAVGTTLEVPFNVDKSGNYDIFIRYLKNQKGGEMSIRIDHGASSRIIGSDNNSSNFVWEKIFSNISLKEGHHTLSLQNIGGFNAVNIFAAIPSTETSTLFEKAYEMANTTRNLFVTEAESGLNVGNNENYSRFAYEDGFDYQSFVKSFQLSDKSTNRAIGASNGTTLVLHSGSEASTELDILKSSNYTIVLRANSCNMCTPVRLSVFDSFGNMISTKNHSVPAKSDSINRSEGGLEWVYFTDVFLRPGQYTLQISSHSERDLDLVVVYSTNPIDFSNDSLETLDGIFKVSNLAANITEVKRIAPTKYEITISNATRPYVLSFAESFDPSWTAYIRDDKGDVVRAEQSKPLYTIINGFHIDDLGNYSITIENKYQQYLFTGGVISLVTVLVCICLYAGRSQISLFVSSLLKRISRQEH
jgi:hypothetical protein